MNVAAALMTAVLLLISVVLGISSAHAATINVVIESDTDSAAGSEIFLLSYSTSGDLISNTSLGGAFSQLDLTSSYSVGGSFYLSDDGGDGGEPNVVPLPASLPLFVFGLIALSAVRRRRSVL